MPSTSVVITGLGITVSRLGSDPGSQTVWDFSETACRQAWDQSGLSGVERVGCTFSASKPLFKPDPNAIPDPPDSINRFVVERFRIRGETRNVIAACATGAYAVALGAQWIEQGICDVVLAGSAEAPVHPLIEAGFRRMGVVSREAVMRPFDRRRSGFVFGCGAGAVILESERHAAQRGARPLARLAGWALGADGHGPVSFNSGGTRIAAVIEKALDRARLSPCDIDHINAHGTATRLNDALEAQALGCVFAEGLRDIYVSATKASTGHLLGAAGSVELVLTVQALLNATVPATPHSEEPDSDCPVRLAASPVKLDALRHALSLSFGFGGPIGVLAVSGC